MHPLISAEPVVTIGQLLLCMVFAAIGLTFHFLLKLWELQRQGDLVTPWEYWRRNPYESLIVIFGVVIMLLLGWVTGQLTYGAAILTGVTANTIGDKLRAKANAKIDQTLAGS